MNDATGNVPDVFPLNTLGPVLRSFSPPAGPFDAAGSWEQNYAVYTMAGAPGRMASLRLRRTVGPGDAVTLDVRYEKAHIGGSQQTVGTLHLRGGDRLSTPSSWSFRSATFDVQRRPIEHTALKRSAVARDGRIEIRDAGQTRRLAVSGPFTLSWALLDAVGRLPGKKTEPARFTLIDHFDQLKPRHTLQFRKTADVPVTGGKTLRLRAYDHLGEGIVPWVYWVDEAGRLLMAVSGLEGYVLET